jgi:hypothetical protein
MNERIRQLIKQADLDDDMFPVDEGWEYPELQKFAELIVRECAQVCLAQRDPANLNYKPSEKFAEAVKQHFGVER